MSAENETLLIHEGERADDLQFKGLRLIQAPASFCFGTDSVLLTHFALSSLKIAKRGSRIIDLGAGSGFISVMLHAAARLQVTAAEIDAAQCDRITRSLILNSVTDGVRVVNADYTEKSCDIGMNYDYAISNPPYFRAGSGGKPENAGATHETNADIGSVAEAASRLLKFGGKFFLCFPAERLAEAFVALCANALEPKCLRLVRSRTNSRPYLALIRANKGAKPGLIIEQELVILDANGEYTPEVKEFYNEK